MRDFLDTVLRTTLRRTGITLMVLGVAAVALAFLIGQPAQPQPPATPRVGLGAPTALDRLTVREPVEKRTYRREKFGSSWLDPDRNRCNTREDVMSRDLTAKKVNGCNVVAGTLRDPYTARVIRYTEHRAYEVQIDHIYPLAHAWREGADRWTDARRRAFANDPRNLLAVDGRANASKGDSGPGEWLPINRKFACTYARRYIAVAYAYRLPVSRDDDSSLRAALRTC